MLFCDIKGDRKLADQFVGREWELQQLRRLFGSSIPQLVVIKGRRRIGKSRLVQEFAKYAPKNTRFVSLSGLAPSEGVTSKSQREDFAQRLGRTFHIPIPYSDDWGDLFWHLAHHTQEGPTVILLDEISWMGMKDPTFLGKLKTAWDVEFRRNPQLIMILCGSVSSWIEENILKNTGFVGRIDLVITLDELSLCESVALLGKKAQHLSSFEIFKLLSVTGGVPRYLENIRPQDSVEENIKRLCFTNGGLLFREFDQIFHDLFTPKSQVYLDILHSLIKNPHATLDEIISLLDRTRSGTFIHYLSDLTQAGFVSRDHTWNMRNSSPSKLSKFRISDNYVRFFMKYIEPLKAKIEKGDFNNRALSTLPGWDGIMGLQFENLVIKNRKKLHELLSIPSDDILSDGPYFQKQTSRHQGCQVDYLIQCKYNSFYVCEIKFSKNPVGPEVVQEVHKKIQALDVPKNVSKRPVLIHVNGVEDSLIGEEFFSHIINFADFL